MTNPIKILNFDIENFKGKTVECTLPYVRNDAIGITILNFVMEEESCCWKI